MKTADILRPSC